MTFKNSQSNTRAVSTSALINMFQKNERASFAFQELFRRSFPSEGQKKDQDALIFMFDFSKKIVLSRLHSYSLYNDRQDIECDVFFKFMRTVEKDPHSFYNREIGEIYSYLNLITRSILSNYLRRGESVLSSSENLYDHEDLYDYNYDIERKIQINEFVDHLNSLIKDSEERLVFDLRFGHDMPPREIAKMYPCMFQNSESVSTIIERIKRRFERDSTTSEYLTMLEF